jgi:hypothetical protein
MFREMESSLKNLSGQERFNYVDSYANQMVQQSTPGNNHYSKKRKFM